MEGACILWSSLHTAGERLLRRHHPRRLQLHGVEERPRVAGRSEPGLGELRGDVGGVGDEEPATLRGGGGDIGDVAAPAAEDDLLHARTG